jgi:Flp pilus assembly protein TadG
MIVPLIGTLGVAGEVSSWFTTNRAMQNAADSAAIAAGTNGDYTHQDTGGLYMYQREANAVAANYGFTNAVSNVTVAATTTTASPCPSGQTCFQVTITKKVPLFLVGIVGYRSGATLNGSPAQLITSTAIATSQSGPATISCITALGATGVVQDLTVNGGPNSNMVGCGVASNGDSTCNGHPIGGTVASYAPNGDTNDCAANGNNAKLSTPLTDPIDAARLTSTEATNDLNHCAGSFPQESAGNLPKTNVWSTSTQSQGKTTVQPPTLTTASDTVVCGDLQLGSDVTLSGSGTLVIENGQLDMNGNNLTANGVTVVFSGTTASASTHVIDDNSHPGNKSVLNLTAPSSAPASGTTSGDFQGVAIYQDSALTSGVNMSSAGSGPTWNLVGLIYAPHSVVTVSGDINANATACIGWVVDTFTINGTGSIISDASDCAASGVTLPGLGGGVRIALIK